MIALLATLLACGGETPPAPPAPAPEAAAPQPEPVPLQVTKAVELARVVQADPDNADAALTAKGSSRAELDALLFEIAADAKLSDAYATALGR